MTTDEPGLSSLVMRRGACPWCGRGLLVRAGVANPLLPEHYETIGAGSSRWCRASDVRLEEVQAMADIRDREGAERFQMRAHP